MLFLIDGYNLLFAAGMAAPAHGPRELERGRYRLLQHLVRHLSPEAREQTVVVFDAKQAPAGASSEQWHGGMRVLFARQQGEADDLIEELLRRDSAPHRLSVVSSDLRLRVAAQRRGAQSIKSEDWLDQIERSPVGPTRPTDSVNHDRGRLPSLDEVEISAWLHEFELDPNDASSDGRDRPSDEAPDGEDWGPFPPGYGGDLTGLS